MLSRTRAVKRGLSLLGEAMLSPSGLVLCQALVSWMRQAAQEQGLQDRHRDNKEARFL